MGQFNGLEAPFIIIILLILGIVAWVIPYWQIFKKAGFSPWLSLLMLVPLLNLALVYYLAFARWPHGPERTS